MSKYKIDIIMDKPEISTDFKIICWSKEFEGKKISVQSTRTNLCW